MSLPESLSQNGDGRYGGDPVSRRSEDYDAADSITSTDPEMTRCTAGGGIHPASTQHTRWARGSTSPRSTPRVQLSTVENSDADLNAEREQSISVINTKHAVLEQASAWSTSSEQSGKQRPGPKTSRATPSANVGSTPIPNSASRFTPKLQQSSEEGDGIYEMRTSRQSGPSSKGTTIIHYPGSEKQQTSNMSNPLEKEGDSRSSTPVYLSEPMYDVPLYRRWLLEQRSRPRLSDAIKKYYQDVMRRIPRANDILPSVDGRHVTVNAALRTDNVDERTGKPHHNNLIRSCRYTVWNFVPRQLYAQFGKLANFYFLCVAILQMIPGLSTTGTYTTIIPLLVFVGISMLKEGIEDYRRNRLDKEENERPVFVLKGRSGTSLFEKEDKARPTAADDEQGWIAVKWREIKVGDVVLLKRDCPAPADLILIQSSDQDGSAYTETKSLDGETNLKLKKAPAEISELCETVEDLQRLQAEFVAEDPNLDLYRFEGRVTIGTKVLPLTNNQIIYRGSILRNTSKAIGLVVYSGNECKIRMNANKSPRIKAPTMQFLVNRVVVIIAGFVLCLAFVMTIAYQIWRRLTESHAWYLKGARVAFGPLLTSFIIMFNTMLPLSLYISLEIVKVYQIFLMSDVDMYDPESDTPMEARTSTINEELGQVSYIFSDKTGTLTNNSMRFRKLSVVGTAWLHDQDLQEEATQERDRPDSRHEKLVVKRKELASRRSDGPRISIGQRQKSASSATLDVNKPDRGRSSSATPNWQPSTQAAIRDTEQLVDYIFRQPLTAFSRKAHFFILSMALCHTCVPEKDDEGNINFQAASPDELALVTGAQDLGYVVIDRTSTSIVVKTYPEGASGQPLSETFEVLDVIEFSSTRKRMSIIVRLPDQSICIFCKGADTTVRKLLRLSDHARDHVNAIERRTSQRKSTEAQESLRRRSVQTSRTAGLPKPNVGALPPLNLSRNSNTSFGPNQTTRDSVDHWLKDQETDVDMSKAKDESRRYSPHVSAQQLSSQSDVWTSLNRNDNSGSSFQTVDVVEETIRLNESATLERCLEHIDDFATEGLRTLLYCHRFITEAEYLSWKETYTAACTSLIDRQEKIEKAGELIEAQLELTGATAIEDKLQQGVPDAIERFRRAGIKLWMLTGDKRETAINIGLSCHLIKDYSTIIILDHEQGDLHSRIATAVADINSKQTAHSVLVIDGQTLALVEAESASAALFTDLAILSDSVICCRASPSQKASLVKMIRTKVKGSVTLAIGDGANDIAMIQEAHVGIGIAGKEGLQAARSSDYSIAQFRFLLKLLLVHGRWNYIRICKYTLGTLWKESLFYLVQALYQRWNGYTGTSLYEPWSLTMFNTLFTSLPVVFMGCFEKDLAASTLLAVPELYSIGQRNGGFNIKLYFGWALLAACEAMIVFFTMYSIYGEALFARDNQLYAMGTLAYTACVTIISLKMQFLELHNKSTPALIAIFLSVGGWWVWNVALSCLYSDTSIYYVKHGLLDGFGRDMLWWLTLILIILAVILFEILVKTVQIAIWPSDVDTFQAYEQIPAMRTQFEEASSELLQQKAFRSWNEERKRRSK